MPRNCHYMSRHIMTSGGVLVHARSIACSIGKLSVKPSRKSPSKPCPMGVSGLSGTPAKNRIAPEKRARLEGNQRAFKERSTMVERTFNDGGTNVATCHGTAVTCNDIGGGGYVVRTPFVVPVRVEVPMRGCTGFSHSGIVVPCACGSALGKTGLQTYPQFPGNLCQARKSG